jgi:PhoPQ-activated pathogenicity-related protein
MKDGQPCLKIDGGPTVKKVRMWEATSETRDFRKSPWKETDLKLDENCTTLDLLAPKSGYRALFAECEYELGTLKFTLSTQIKILEAKK